MTLYNVKGVLVLIMNREFSPESAVPIGCMELLMSFDFSLGFISIPQQMAESPLCAIVPATKQKNVRLDIGNDEEFINIIR